MGGSLGVLLPSPAPTLAPASTPTPPTHAQIEIDFKAECRSGELIESLAASAPTGELLASNGAGPEALTFTHMLRRCEGDACTELVRARRDAAS